MTTFSISKKSIESFVNFVTKAKDINTNSKYIFSLEDNNMILSMESSFFAVKFYIPITDLIIDNGLKCFSNDTIQIAQTLQKLIKNSDSLKISIETIDTATKTTIENIDNNSKISFVNYETKTEKAIEEIINAFDLAKNAKFSGVTYTIKPDEEFFTVMYPICKSMVISGNEVNSAVLCRNIIRYCDPQGIIEYTLQNEISPYDKEIYIQSMLVDYLKPFIKVGVEVTLDETNQFAYIESKDAGFYMVLGLDNNKFQYPSESELDFVIPDPENHTKITFNKDEFLDAIHYFDNIFKADWKWSNIEFDASKGQIDNGKIKLSHNDYNASVETFVNVIVIENNMKDVDCRFLIGSAYLHDILNLMDEDTISMEYSAIPLGELHGTGFIVSCNNIKAICIKILKSNA